MHQLYDNIGVTKLELQSLRIRFGQYPLLVAFHSESYGSSGGDGIKSIVVAQVMGLCNGFHISNLALAPECSNTFVFRSFSLGAPVLALSDLSPSSTIEGAGKASLRFYKDFFTEGLSVYFI